jgi:hypothetical protein
MFSIGVSSKEVNGAYLNADRIEATAKIIAAPG